MFIYRKYQLNDICMSLKLILEWLFKVDDGLKHCINSAITDATLKLIDVLLDEIMMQQCLLVL